MPLMVTMYLLFAPSVGYIYFSVVHAILVQLFDNVRDQDVNFQGSIMRQFLVNHRISKVFKSYSGIVVMVSLICLINDDGIVIRQGYQSFTLSMG